MKLRGPGLDGDKFQKRNSWVGNPELNVGLRLGRSKGRKRDKQTSESSKAAGQEQEELGFRKKGLQSRS